MAIRSIELTDFSVFRSAKLELSPGINVLIGENATGKTHVMKALYSVLPYQGASLRGPSTEQKLELVFRPDGGQLGRLGHRRPGQRTAKIAVRDDLSGSITVSIATRSSKATTTVRALHKPAKTVFLPSREGLAMFEGFMPAYLNRELSFDETYYDLAVALSATALRGKLPTALQEIGHQLEKMLGGKVVLDSRFYVRGAGGSMLEAPLLSEGMRKLASVLRLLQNGELREAGLLLWDEPEANLNPKLTVAVAEMLATLAKNDVQIVLATHDYLLTETLGMFAERDPKLAARFFCFQRAKDRSHVVVEGADRLSKLSNNPLRDEFLAHYNRLNAIDE